MPSCWPFSAWGGYVAVALERGFIATIPSPPGARFVPAGSVPRLAAARFLLGLLGDRNGSLSSRAAAAVTPQAPARGKPARAFFAEKP